MTVDPKARSAWRPPSLWISLHTADPGEFNPQTTFELAYPAYRRQLFAGDDDGHGMARSAAAIDFPKCDAGAETAAWVAVGTAESGAGLILTTGKIAPPQGVNVHPGVIFRFAPGCLSFDMAEARRRMIDRLGSP